jgi:tetratricopeptide (TPR) repeat protein
MATVSGKGLFTLKATLLASVFITGCSSLMPVERQANDAGNDKGTQTGHQQVMAPSDNAPLPRQAYNSTGEKVPYVPQPNPYTREAAAIPAEARSTFVVGNYLFHQEGNLKAAQARFRELTEKYPSLAGPWVRLGAIAEKGEKYDEAINDYKKAINANKNNVNAYISLGLLQRRQGYFSDAQNTYIEALNVWKDFPEAHLNLAILYDLYANEPEEAQKHYEAYDFLTGRKDENVKKWLVEVKQRTGIERSFIDIPPKEIVEVPVEKADDAGAAAGGGSSG